MAPNRSACAVPAGRDRMKSANANKLYRKSGSLVFFGPGTQLVQSFVKFDIFGSFLRLAVQRGRTKGLKGFFFIEKGTLRSGADRGT
jgi:hypothetical protein